MAGMDKESTNDPFRWTSRPGRPALVAPDLNALHGPTSGVVELPHRMVWLPPQSRRFDLDDPFDLRHMYAIVLREAVQVAELNTWLDAETLFRLWPEPDLVLPRGVRNAWQRRYPRLSRHRARANVVGVSQERELT